MGCFHWLATRRASVCLFLKRGMKRGCESRGSTSGVPPSSGPLKWRNFTGVSPLENGDQRQKSKPGWMESAGGRWSLQTAYSSSKQDAPGETHLERGNRDSAFYSLTRKRGRDSPNSQASTYSDRWREVSLYPVCTLKLCESRPPPASAH
jgi:hypothetical protein